MGRMWRAAKSVLGLHLCASSFAVHSSSADDCDDCDGAGSSAASTPRRSSHRRGSSGSGSGSNQQHRLPKSTCAICLESMKTGTGQALFTAECSHTFHFSCIASNVRHGSLICPVCRASWKEVPWQAPGGGSPSPRRSQAYAYQLQAAWSPVAPRRSSRARSPLPSPSRSSPYVFLQDHEEEQDPVIRIIDESIANAQSYRLPSPSAVSEPCVYDDDEDTSCISSTASSSARSSNAAGEDSTSFCDTDRRRVQLLSFAEVDNVPFSEARDRFTVLVNVKAPQLSSSASSSPSPSSVLDPSRRAPVDLVTILDVSGSMAGVKLLLLKRAMSFVIRNLSSQDRLSVIVFSSSAKRLFPLKRMVEEGRQYALRAIDTLVCTGGTNIAEGLRKGAKVLEERRHANPVASIMLLSDGQDTYTIGMRGQALPFDHQKLLPGSIRQQRTRIPVHTFGFGADHDAATMHSISEISGGTFSFIQAEAAVQDAFAQCVGGLLSVLVQDVELVIAVPDSARHGGTSIKSIQAGSYRSSISEDSLQGLVKLGDLYADEERDILVEMQLPCVDKSAEGQQYDVLEISCGYTVPAHHGLLQATPSKLCISRLEGTAAVTSLAVDRQKNRLLAAQKIAEAGTLADAGDIDAAQRTLQDAQATIQASRAVQSGDKLSEALESELREIGARIGSRQMYERSGRAYILSAQSSHLMQRATMRGHSVEGHSRDYQTPSMTGMILRSHLEGSGVRRF